MYHFIILFMSPCDLMPASFPIASGADKEGKVAGVERTVVSSNPNAKLKKVSALGFSMYSFYYLIHVPPSSNNCPSFHAASDADEERRVIWVRQKNMKNGTKSDMIYRMQ